MICFSICLKRVLIFHMMKRSAYASFMSLVVLNLRPYMMPIH